MKYFTTGSTQTIPDSGYGIFIQVNAALTGIITVTDAGSTVAIITNPTVGSQYRYYGFNGAAAVTTSTTCDVTVSVIPRP